MQDNKVVEEVENPRAALQWTFSATRRLFSILLFQTVK